MTVGVEGEGGQGSPGSEARVVRVEAGGSQACGAMQTGNEGVIMWYKHSIPMIELRGKKKHIPKMGQCRTYIVYKG